MNFVIRSEHNFTTSVLGSLFVASLIILVAWNMSFPSIPATVGLVWIPIAVCWATATGQLVPCYRNLDKKYWYVIFATMVPMLKCLLVTDMKGIGESAMITVGFLAAPLLGFAAMHRSFPLILLGFYLLICLVGLKLNETNDVFLLGGFVSSRGSLAPPGGTHHYLGCVVGVLLLSTRTADSIAWKTILFILLILSGARTCWVAFVCAVVFGHFITLVFSRSKWLLLASILSFLIVVVQFSLPSIVEQIESSPIASKLSLGGADEVDRYGLATGRDGLWKYHIDLFYQHPFLGSPVKEVRPEATEGVAGNRYFVAPDGTILNASTESLFDYYFARDGVFGLSAVISMVLMLIICFRQGNINGTCLVMFCIISAFGNPITRITYSHLFLVFSATLWRSVFMNDFHANRLRV